MLTRTITVWNPAEDAEPFTFTEDDDGVLALLVCKTYATRLGVLGSMNLIGDDSPYCGQLDSTTLSLAIRCERTRPIQKRFLCLAEWVTGPQQLSDGGLIKTERELAGSLERAGETDTANLICTAKHGDVVTHHEPFNGREWFVCLGAW